MSLKWLEGLVASTEEAGKKGHHGAQDLSWLLPLELPSPQEALAQIVASAHCKAAPSVLPAEGIPRPIPKQEAKPKSPVMTQPEPSVNATVKQDIVDAATPTP